MPIAPQVPGVPTAVTPDASPTRYTTTQGPAPDGLVVADDILAVHQIALNIQDWIRNFIPGARTQSFLSVDTGSAVQQSGSTTWTHTSLGDGALPPHWVQSTLDTGSETIYIPLSNALAYRGRLTGVDVRISPDNTHTGLPAILPRVRIVRVSSTNALSVSVLADEADDSPNFTTYNGQHTIAVGLASPVDLPSSAYRYWIAVTGESGANAKTGLVINSADLVIEE